MEKSVIDPKNITRREVNKQFTIVKIITFILLIINTACTTTSDMVLKTTSLQTLVDESVSTKTMTNNNFPSLTNNKGKLTNTPQMKESSTVIPTKLYNEGPWLVLGTVNGLWALNHDGTGARRIVPKPPEYQNINTANEYYYIPFATSPSQKQLAYSIYGYDMDPALYDEIDYFQWMPDLYIMTFPELTFKKITTLFAKNQLLSIVDQDPEGKFGDYSWNAISQINAAITRINSMAWSSQGEKLAFAAAIDGPSSDVYILDLPASKILRLTDGATTQAVDLYFSPNNQYVINTAAIFINTGRNGPDLDSTGMSAAPTEGGEVLPILGGNNILYRWISDEAFLSASYSDYCWRSNLRISDIRSGGGRMVWEGLFTDADIDPKTKTIIIGNTFDETFEENLCPIEFPSGLYLISNGKTTPVKLKVFAEGNTGESYVVYWMEELQEFFVQSEEGVVLISPSGEISDFPFVDSSIDPINFAIPIVSPSGKYWAIPPNRNNGLWIWKPDGFIKQIYEKSVCNVIWRPDRDAVYFYTGEGDPSSIFIAEAPDFNVREIVSGIPLACEISPKWVVK